MIFQFSLLCLNFSLLVWISHFYGASTRISHFYVWISHFWSLFQWNSHFSSRRHSHAGRPNPTPASPFRVAGRPTTAPALPMTWLIPCHWWAGARRQITTRHAKSEKSEKFKHKSEIFKHKSEKFAPPKVRNSNQKWEIHATTQEKWEIKT